MAQPVDPTQLIADAAAKIENGDTVDENTRYQAAGFSAQQAMKDGDTDLLDLIVLVYTGRWRAAFALLAKMAFATAHSAAPTGSQDPFGPLTHAGGGSTSSNTAQQPAAQPGGGQSTGRRGKR